MAASRNGFLFDEFGNYAITGGDFTIGDTTLQEAYGIIRANQGEYKQHPLVGCNLSLYKNAKANTADVLRVIKKQTEAAGLDYEQIKTEIVF